MKIRKLLTIFVTLMLCLSLSGCLSTLMISGEDNANTTFVSNGSSEKTDSSDTGTKTIKSYHYNYSTRNDSTKDESVEADQVFELLVNDNTLKTDSRFASLGYDVSEDDALLYAKSSAVIGNSSNEYKMLAYLGYEIDEDVRVKAEKYSKAKTLIREGDYAEAYQLLKKIPDYADSRYLAEDMFNQGLVNFRVGDIGPAGGYIFYDKGSYSDGWRYLEAAPNDLSEAYYYGGYGTEIGNTSEAVGTGKSNTETIIKKLGNETCAAKACSDYIYNGYDDWFLPSKDELNLMYTNLKKKGIGNFADRGVYWSSSEYDRYFAWAQYFYDGELLGYGLNRYYGVYDVRPVRMF